MFAERYGVSVRFWFSLLGSRSLSCFLGVVVRMLRVAETLVVVESALGMLLVEMG